MTGKSEEVENKAEETVDSAQALAEAQAQADKYLDMARRLQADFDNFRKRTQRENEEFRKYACSSIIGDLLTVVDDLDRALEHAGEETEFVKGIRGVRANDGLVAEVFQKGYTLNGKVLRYSKVKVTKKKAETEGEEKCQE